MSIKNKLLKAAAKALIQEVVSKGVDFAFWYARHRIAPDGAPEDGVDKKEDDNA